MPFKSEAQRKAMYAAAAGRSNIGIPKSVGEKFVEHRADSDTINGAGILFRNGSEFLLTKRADNGVWEQPGGHIQDGEGAQEAAIRECMEELGSCPVGVQYLLSSNTKDGGGTYQTFVQDAAKFDVKLNHESIDHGWFSKETLPPETRVETVALIQALSGTELDIARAIRDGILTSPQKYENIWLFDVRITGTGTSYRTALEEYVYRPPENFLTDEFVERCNGLALVFQHPVKSVLLDTQEFRDRSIGNVVLPYIKADEVRGIAKVLDEDAARLMQTTHTSTSPVVVFRRAGSTETIELEDGKSVLIEGVPSYLESLAICEAGVWDKGGEPAGISLQENIMAGENDKDKAPAWADALVEKVDSVCARMDSVDEYMKADKARKDSEAKEIEKEAKELEKGEKKEEKTEAKHAEEAKKIEEEAKKEEKEKADSAARADAEQKAAIAEMQARIDALTKPISPEDRDALAKAQARADSVFQMFGESALAPLAAETPIAYRQRLASKLQKHSAASADIKLDALTEKAFVQIEDRIYADAQARAMSPEIAVAGRLIPHVRKDSAGREITTYTGDMDAWLRMFKSKPVYITGINTNQNRGAN